MGVARDNLLGDHRRKIAVLDATKNFVPFRRRDSIRTSNSIHDLLGVQCSGILLDELRSLIINEKPWPVDIIHIHHSKLDNAYNSSWTVRSGTVLTSNACIAMD